ncbi:MAG TPA: hypothetical protein VK453_08320 [Micromonosporaceae bacterium]|nr:hypothetical protein [Micromonosporaceae bacterium]
MTQHVAGQRVYELERRIAAIDWTGSFDRTVSRGYLMKEHLRRAAWWAYVTKAPGYPFPDVAAAVNPAIRADPQAVARVTAQLASWSQRGWVTRVTVHALHFAALLDAGVPLPQAPAEPFEPLLMMFERGGGFGAEGGGLIEVDTLGIRPGTVVENLRQEPYVELDKAALDALDVRG